MFLHVSNSVATAYFSWAVMKKCLLTPNRTLRTDKVMIPSKSSFVNNEHIGFANRRKEVAHRDVGDPE